MSLETLSPLKSHAVWFKIIKFLTFFKYNFFFSKLKQSFKSLVTPSLTLWRYSEVVSLGLHLNDKMCMCASMIEFGHTHSYWCVSQAYDEGESKESWNVSHFLRRPAVTSLQDPSEVSASLWLPRASLLSTGEGSDRKRGRLWTCVTLRDDFSVLMADKWLDLSGWQEFFKIKKKANLEKIISRLTSYSQRYFLKETKREREKRIFIVRIFYLLPTPLEHAGESLRDPGPCVAVSGGGWVPAGASGGQTADGLRCLAALSKQQQRLLHVPHPCHRPKLWRLLRLPATTNPGMHGILRTGYVRSSLIWLYCIIGKSSSLCLHAHAAVTFNKLSTQKQFNFWIFS